MSAATSRKLLIGLSPRMLRDIPVELGFRGKTLQYLEQSVPHWLMAMGALVVLVPTVEPGRRWRPATVTVEDYVQALDGLVLQGGVDVDPAFYGEPVSHSRPPLDPERDRFEMQLLHAFVAAGKPVFGICRGMQLINVAYGGNLHQDLHQDAATSSAHHVHDLYDEHLHEVRIEPGSWMARIYGDVAGGTVNSIHHQGVRTLGAGLLAEAWSDDGVVEALRREGDAFVVGVQWHPEFHDHRYPQLLPADPLMQAFFEAAFRRRDGA